MQEKKQDIDTPENQNNTHVSDPSSLKKIRYESPTITTETFGGFAQSGPTPTPDIIGGAG